MERRISNYILPSGSRADKRFSLITHFMQEEPGHGNGDAASRYRYDVESYGNYSIYLLRPTQLNKALTSPSTSPDLPSKSSVFTTLPVITTSSPHLKAAKYAILNRIHLLHPLFEIFMPAMTPRSPKFMPDFLTMPAQSIRFRLFCLQ